MFQVDGSTSPGSSRRPWRVALSAALSCALASALATAQDASATPSPGAGDAGSVASSGDAGVSTASAPGDGGEAATAGDAGVSNEARRQAAASFDQGLAAFNANNFLLAATFFETADEYEPSTAASVNAIRAHRGVRRPEHDARAATLALRLLNRYPSDTRVTGYAWRVIDELSPSLTRLVVRCQGCDLLVNRRASDHEVFLPPGHHSVSARWGTRTAARELDTAAGATERVELSPPSTALSLPPLRAVQPPGGSSGQGGQPGGPVVGPSTPPSAPPEGPTPPTAPAQAPPSQPPPSQPTARAPSGSPLDPLPPPAFEGAVPAWRRDARDAYAFRAVRGAALRGPAHGRF